MKHFQLIHNEKRAIAGPHWWMRWCLLFCGLFFSGCANVDFAEERERHADEYTPALRTQTDKVLPADHKLDLQACIRLAREHNLKLEVARINTRIAELERDIAFSAFLPHLELTGRYHRTGRHQATAAGGRFLPLSDQAITEWSLQLQQNVFAPESWFMYTAYTKGKDIKRLVEKRTMQQLALRITTHFYACLALNEQQLALRASRDHAARLVEEIKALKREGLVSNSELEKAEAFFTSTQVAVKRNKRNLKQTKATLLRTMGLYPATDIKLRHGYQLQASDQTLSERIATALVSRPELATADRMVAVNEDQIKMAVSQFLPQLGVFADLSYSSNSFLKYQRLLTYGASGVMAVFEGFANVAAYKKATKDAEKQRLKREQLCLNIMLEVIRAHTAFSDAKDREQVARKKEDAAIESFYEIRAKWREGLVLKSALLEATRTYTKATTNFVTAKYQTQVAVATLLTAMGTFSGDELWRD